ncbi:MAG: dihydrolipoamide acetyltransferase family protein [Alphaproteobacteria bacterium]
MSTFALPDLGEGLQEAEIVSWQVGVGDHVVADQPLVSVETDKAVVEVPSPRAGRIAKLFGAPGDRVVVGAPLVEFEETAAADTGTVVGRLQAEAAPAKPATKAKPSGAQKPAQPKPASAKAKPSAPPPEAGAAIKATPAVRALARQLGVDLSRVKPTGAQGQITSVDVEQAAEAPQLGEGYEPLRGVRRAMADNMARSHAEVVPATITGFADVDPWANAKADVTLRLIRAIVAGCRAEPALNAWYDGRAMARKLHERIDLGIAIDTGDGLFAPVLHDVGNREPADIRRGIERLKADLRARSVPLSELRGQTITLSNFGTIAGIHAALVVVPPQVAIVGAGVIGRQVVVVGGRYEARSLLPLSLTFDHRCITGGEAARFLAALTADLEKEA